MRVFVTGATGLIGSAVVQELLGASHQVLGLARSDAAAGALARLGVEAYRGELSNTESLAAGAGACDGVIHMGFVHDFSDIVESCKTDRLAIEAMGSALAGSDRPLVVTTGSMLLKRGHLGTEDDAADPESVGSFRVPNEQAALRLGSRGVRVSVVRPAPSVHGPGDNHGFVPMLISIAREKGVSAYVGDGLNHWPAVHRLDAAHLFRLALEKGTAGSRYHAVGDEGVPVRDIAEVIGRRLNVPVVSQSAEGAAKHFGWFSAILAADNPTSNALTQERLGWHPVHPGLLADLEDAHYFAA